MTTLHRQAEPQVEHLADYPAEPPYLPPRRPKSTPDLKAKRLSLRLRSENAATPPYLPPRRPKSTAIPTRRNQCLTFESSDGMPVIGDRPWTGSSSTTQVVPRACERRHTLDARLAYDANAIHQMPALTVSENTSLAARKSSPRFDSRLSKYPRHSISPAADMEPTVTDEMLHSKPARPRSHPPPRRNSHIYTQDPSRSSATLPHSPSSPEARPGPRRTVSLRQPLPQQSSVSRSSSQRSLALQPKPKRSFTRLQSLDSLITYREEKAEWKRASAFLQSALSDPEQAAEDCCERDLTIRSEAETAAGGEVLLEEKEKSEESTPGTATPLQGQEGGQHGEQAKNKFRTFAAEVGFCFTIAMTQFLAGMLPSKIFSRLIVFHC